MSISLPQPALSPSSNQQEISSDWISSNVNQGNSSSLKTIRRTYDHITAILYSAESSEELTGLQDLASLLATRARKAMRMDMVDSGSPERRQGNFMEYEGLLYRHLQEYQKISRSCTCVGISKQQHKVRLQFSINSVEEKIRAMKEDWRKATGAIRLEARNAFAATYAAKRKVLSAVFITKLGFVGMIFQKGHEVKQGDSLVVLDGIPTSVVLRTTPDSSTNCMRTVAYVVGLIEMDIGKMIDLGIFNRKDFRII
jgi:hypothetical protein